MIRAAMKIHVKRGPIFYRWILRASNGQTLAVSETYWGKSNAVRAAEKLGKAIKVPVVIE